MSRPEERLAAAAIPPDAVLAEPWQAEALALVIALQESGLLEAGEWSAALAAVIEAARRRGDPADGSTYGSHLLTALEAILTGKGLLSRSALSERRAAWEQAHRLTPHGQPVILPAPEG